MALTTDHVYSWKYKLLGCLQQIEISLAAELLEFSFFHELLVDVVEFHDGTSNLCGYGFHCIPDGYDGALLVLFDVRTHPTREVLDSFVDSNKSTFVRRQYCWWYAPEKIEGSRG